MRTQFVCMEGINLVCCVHGIEQSININIRKLFEKKTKLMTSFVYILVYMETFAVT